MKIHRKLFGLALKIHGYLPVVAIISFLNTCIVIGQMYFASSIIAIVFSKGEMPSTDQIFWLAGFIAGRSVILWIRERYTQIRAIQIKSRIKKDLFNHILNLGPSFAKSSNTGETIATLTDGIEKFDDYFTKYVPSVVQVIILPMVIILFTLFVDWPSALIMLITAPLIIFFMALIGTFAKKLTRRQWKEMRRLSSHFLDALQGLKTLKLLGAGSRETKNVNDSSNGFIIVTMGVLRVAFLSGLVLELAASISIALVAVQIGIRLVEGFMIFQTGLFILMLAPEFYLPFRALGQHHHTGMEAAAVAHGLFSITSINVNPKQSPDYALSIPSNPCIKFQDVHFTYHDGKYAVLKGINCELRPETLTALVGPTGAGKSTFAALILRYLRPASGMVLADEIPIEQFDNGQWLEKVAFVPQHPWFFNASVIENLLMANPLATREKVIEAASQAEAHHFIEQLPQGYNTLLHENAARLSGGEKQRLAIARAFLKNAPVLILDEPTSNLDPESEQLIADATNRIVKNRTTLIIAHRLNTVKKADQILVFSDGTIVESGHHNHLLAKNGIYTGFLDAINQNNIPPL